MARDVVCSSGFDVFLKSPFCMPVDVSADIDHFYCWKLVLGCLTINNWCVSGSERIFGVNANPLNTPRQLVHLFYVLKVAPILGLCVQSPCFSCEAFEDLTRMAASGCWLLSRFENHREHLPAVYSLAAQPCFNFCLLRVTHSSMGENLMVPKPLF